MQVSGVIILTCLLPLIEKSIQRKRSYIRELNGYKNGCIAQARHSQSCWSNLDQPWWLEALLLSLCQYHFQSWIWEELANYGEYSGAPSTEHTPAKTLISLMCKWKDPRGKIFICGGRIANFTNVAATFIGRVKAIVSFQCDLEAHNVEIWGRRSCRIKLSKRTTKWCRKGQIWLVCRFIFMDLRSESWQWYYWHLVLRIKMTFQSWITNSIKWLLPKSSLDQAVWIVRK